MERRFGQAGLQEGVLIHCFCSGRVNRIINKAKKKIVEFSKKKISAKSLAFVNSLSAKSVLAGEKLVAMYSIST